MRLLLGRSQQLEKLDLLKEKWILGICPSIQSGVLRWLPTVLNHFPLNFQFRYGYLLSHASKRGVKGLLYMELTENPDL